MQSNILIEYLVSSVVRKLVGFDLSGSIQSANFNDAPSNYSKGKKKLHVSLRVYVSGAWFILTLFKRF